MSKYANEVRMRKTTHVHFLELRTCLEDRRETMSDSGFRMNHSTINVVITCFPYVLYRQGHVWVVYMYVLQIARIPRMGLPP